MKMTEHDFAWIMALILVCLFAFMISSAIKKQTGKTIQQRMETCDFPSYDQILECEKIKAIRGVK